MEKRIWSRPEMNEFAFAANEYVSTCYSGVCDTHAGNVEPKDIFLGEVITWWKKIFFAWDDKNGNGNVDYFDGEIGDVVNDDNKPCNEPFNLEGSYRSVASPDVLYYDDNPWPLIEDYKPRSAITDQTVWTTAYHFNGSNSTHLCKVLNESGKS